MLQSPIKTKLLAKLKQEHCFWSYAVEDISNIPDDILIEKTLLHLDLEDIDQLFKIYSLRKIKRVWLDYLIPKKSIYIHSTVSLHGITLR